ncbi:hyaluronidase-2-like [Aquarana catesbeiana]|uniref:hyaluronidase-2-like n=1 Tax=Aquarana catesbeiana TaxID=8400 RepID=UPI003CC97331
MGNQTPVSPGKCEHLHSAKKVYGYSSTKAGLLVKNGEGSNTVRYGGHQRYCIINKREVRVPLAELVDSNVNDMEPYRHGATNGQSVELNRVQNLQGGIQKRGGKPPNGPPLRTIKLWEIQAFTVVIRTRGGGKSANVVTCSGLSKLKLQSFSMTTHFALTWVLLGLLTIVVDVQSSNMETPKPTVRPMFSGRPFMVAWNAPTQNCQHLYNVSLDLRLFDINSTPSEGFVDQNLTLFYKERLGLYPFYDEDHVSVNGGVPQNASLRAHLDQMLVDINKYMPSVQKEGLGVIDWEEWRPIYVRNWQRKGIYRQASQQLVASRYPDWTDEEVNKEAQFQFDHMARRFLVDTLRYAKKLRPRQLWGYYLLPDCYNYDYWTNWNSYDGKCPDAEMVRNDHLWWLWKESTALYPSIYLGFALRSSVKGHEYVHYRVKEAMRIAPQHRSYSLPVFVYTRPTYRENNKLLSQMDLISTIGESAAQGAAGVIFWGDTGYGMNEETCLKITSFLEEDLGQYIVNVTTAASLCSQVLCGGNGRCLRKRLISNVFLHLNPANFRIVRAPPGSNASVPMWAEGRLSSEDVDFLHEHFQCQCYLDSPGNTCSIKYRNAAEPMGHAGTVYSPGY